LSNAADLYVHAGDLQKAADLYKKCIRLNSVDFHSIMGLGWIALVHDKNDTLAERIFKFVQSKNKLPDPLFKLYQMAQGRGDMALEKKYANEFVTKSTDTIYGHMYNKYVIEIYTGILNQPAKAEDLAKDELNNRATPQTYAWYAYSLFKNNKKDEAYKVFQQYVSGQPLEGLELYYMGVLMKGLGKGYNAGEFFKAAEKNKYDLSPGMAKDLAAELEE
jgi:tetratricopeptide (TPR) repeat protein